LSSLGKGPELITPAAALKFFRSLIGLQDEFYNQQMMQDHLFEPILNILDGIFHRDNLLNSACLEFFDFIRKGNVKVLVNHLVENYREKIKDITYVDTFTNLILKYDQMQGYSANMDASFLDTEEDTPERSQVSGGHRWQGVRDLDPTEEEYFNTSDDEDEVLAKSPSNRGAINGASPLSKPLVDYHSDEEGETMDSDLSPSIQASKDINAQAIKSNENNTAGATTQRPAQPPERLSEKRRREEDEEDELVKLSQQHPKRRSSSGSVSSVASSTSNVIKRKKSFTNTRDAGGGTPKKIAISLSPAIKSGVEGNSGSEDGS
jgi:protein phosphatase 4 regulatory subunit 3